MKAAYKTLGCRLNQYETEGIRQIFEQNGYKTVPFTHEADVYIVNSCTVTNSADSESRRLARKAKRTNPNAVVILTGCYAENSWEEIEKIGEIDLIIGNNLKSKVYGLFLEYKDTENKVYLGENESYDELSVDFFDTNTRAFLKIQDGCDYSCTYCAIHFARGKQRSREMDRIKSQIKRLTENGYREIVLTGIHLGQYGKEWNYEKSLLDVLRLLDSEDGVRQYRLSSININELTDPILDYLAASDKFCRHFHIPLQSASQKILKAMNRQYTSAFYKERIKKILGLFPGVGIGSDVIVGFPGETEEDFMETYNYLKDTPFFYFHIFPFSRRKGTPAAQYPDQVNGEVIKERAARLKSLKLKKIEEFTDSWLDKSMRILVESRKDGRYHIGLAGNYVKVFVDSKKFAPNEIYEVVGKQKYKDGLICE